MSKRWLLFIDAAKHVALSPKLFDEVILAGKGPAFRNFLYGVNTAMVFDVDDLDEWMLAQPVSRITKDAQQP